MTKKEYDDCTIERKAEIVADMIANGFIGDRDTICERRGDRWYFETSVVDGYEFSNEGLLDMFDEYLAQTREWSSEEFVERLKKY
jgi:hypothetical protein